MRRYLDISELSGLLVLLHLLEAAVGLEDVGVGVWLAAHRGRVREMRAFGLR